MAQSLSNLLVHIIFSTKDRVPFIDDPVRADLHAYLAAVLRNSKHQCFRVGGPADHVHMAIRLNRTVAVSKLVEEVKSVSSSWFKTKSSALNAFSWQRGYGAFSLSARDLSPLIDYISGQEEHHRARGFQDEFRAFLIENGVEFDERYVWD